MRPAADEGGAASSSIGAGAGAATSGASACTDSVSDLTERSSSGRLSRLARLARLARRKKELEDLYAFVEDVEAPDEATGDRPLHFACHNGHEGCVKLLLDAGSLVKSFHGVYFGPPKQEKSS